MRSLDRSHRSISGGSMEASSSGFCHGCERKGKLKKKEGDIWIHPPFEESKMKKCEVRVPGRLKMNQREYESAMSVSYFQPSN